jgi:hypothetical protein
MTLPSARTMPLEWQNQTVSQDPLNTSQAEQQNQMVSQDPLDTSQANLWTHLSQSISNTLGASVQLTDEQFRILLDRLTSPVPNLSNP